MCKLVVGVSPQLTRACAKGLKAAREKSQDSCRITTRRKQSTNSTYFPGRQQPLRSGGNSLCSVHYRHSLVEITASPSALLLQSRAVALIARVPALVALQALWSTTFSTLVTDSLHLPCLHATLPSLHLFADLVNPMLETIDLHLQGHQLEPHYVQSMAFATLHDF